LIRTYLGVQPVAFDHLLFSVKVVEHSLYVGFPVEVEYEFGQYQTEIVVASLD